MFMSYSAWKSQQHLLNRMGIKELNAAYFSYPGVQTYLAFMTLAVIAAVYYGGAPILLIWAFMTAVIGHPVIWYITHRFILHSKLLMRFKFTAKLWKRTHYDHHQRPNELSVLFGGLHTTLPPIALIYGPIGFWIAGPGGAAACNRIWHLHDHVLRICALHPAFGFHAQREYAAWPVSGLRETRALVAPLPRRER